MNASNDTSFYESFCSTAQRAFDASRDRCTVKLMACKPSSQHWAVQVTLHREYDPTGTGWHWGPPAGGLAEPSGLLELGQRALFPWLPYPGGLGGVQCCH